MTSLSTGQASGELGTLLRHWRNSRGKSQLQLSADTGVSQRHLSFIESGRSAPSRQKLMDIARALDVPLRDCNTLLLAAGYAPLFSESNWDAVEMRSVNAALERTLRQHDPFPALVMDRYWNVLLTNEAAPRFFGSFIDLGSRPTPRNMLHLMFDPNGMRPFIANWEDVARGLLDRVYRESVGRVLDEKTRALIAALLAYPDVRTDWRTGAASQFLPVMPLSFIKDGKVLNYFSMVTTVGSPQSVAAQELRMECMFPLDEATETHHIVLMNSAPS